jgi:hypothetical protein
MRKRQRKKNEKWQKWAVKRCAELGFRNVTIVPFERRYWKHHPVRQWAVEAIHESALFPTK